MENMVKVHIVRNLFALSLLFAITTACAQYPQVTIRQIQEVPRDSMRLLDSLGCIRWTLQASPYYRDTVTITGVCVVPARVLNYTAFGFTLLLADTGSRESWGGVFIRPSAADTPLVIQWGILTVQPGDLIRFTGYVDEFPRNSCGSTTTVVPILTVPLQIIGTAPIPPPVPARILDFYSGYFPLGQIRFSTGEPYEGMRVFIRNVVVHSWVDITRCTFNMIDSLGNMMSTYRASTSFQCPPIVGAAIDTIRGFILTASGGEVARGYRIAPIYTQDIIPVSVPQEEFFPASNILEQNYPNPFNPATTLSFVIGSRFAGSFVRLKVYNVLGSEVATLVEGMREPGMHEVTWSAQGLSSGLYLYRLTVVAQSGEIWTEAKKMLLVR